MAQSIDEEIAKIQCMVPRGDVGLGALDKLLERVRTDRFKQNPAGGGARYLSSATHDFATRLAMPVSTSDISLLRTKRREVPTAGVLCLHLINLSPVSMRNRLLP
jgi:hypothetical protein